MDFHEGAPRSDDGGGKHPAFEAANDGDFARKVSYSSDEAFGTNENGRFEKRASATEAYPLSTSATTNRMHEEYGISHSTNTGASNDLSMEQTCKDSIETSVNDLEIAGLVTPASMPPPPSIDKSSNASVQQNVLSLGEDNNNEATTEPPKKKRKKSMAYSQAEVERLMEAVGCVQPTCDEDWESVKVVCETLSPPDAHVRSVKSLKLKFSSVSLKLVMKALAAKPVGESALDLNPLGDAFGSNAAANSSNLSIEQGDDTSKEAGGILEQNPMEENAVALDDNGAAFDTATSQEHGDGEGIAGDAEKLSDAMIGLFESFHAANGMVLGKETLDSFMSRLETVEHTVGVMKSMVESINANTTAILMALQKP